MLKNKEKTFANIRLQAAQECLKLAPEAKSLVIMLPIGAEGAALKYAVQAIDAGLNVVTSFRSLSVSENLSLKKFAASKGVVIKEIGPRLDVVEMIAGTAPEKSCEVLPKISYTPKAPVIFVGGTSHNAAKGPQPKNWELHAWKEI